MAEAVLTERKCGNCKHYQGLKCELKPNLIVLSPVHPACENFEPKGEDEPAAPQQAGEPQPRTLPEEKPAAEEEQAIAEAEEERPILPSRPLKEWRVG